MRLAAPKKGFRDNSALPRCRTTDQNRVSRIGSGIDESGTGRSGKRLRPLLGKFARWMRFVVRVLVAQGPIGRCAMAGPFPRHQAGVAEVFDRRVAHAPKCS
jgi:hypothetical protein